MVSMDRRHTETFGCSFYDSLASRCGCESVDLLQVRLFDPFGAPMPRVPCTVTVGGHDVFATSDEEGWIETRIVGAHERAVVAWGEPIEDGGAGAGEAAHGEGDGSDADPPAYPYRLEVFLNYDAGGDTEELALRRLYNLGYEVDFDRAADEQRGPVQRFQLHYRERFDLASISGDLDDATMAAISEVHDSCDPDLWPEDV
jgi:hypothetical protein